MTARTLASALNMRTMDAPGQFFPVPAYPLPRVPENEVQFLPFFGPATLPDGTHNPFMYLHPSGF